MPKKIQILKRRTPSNAKSYSSHPFSSVLVDERSKSEMENIRSSRITKKVDQKENKDKWKAQENKDK